MKVGSKVLSLIVALATVAGSTLSTAAAAGTGQDQTYDSCYVDSGYTDDEEGHYATLDEAISHVKDSGTVYLESNLSDLTTTIKVDKPITIDGNNNTLSFTKSVNDEAENSGRNGLLIWSDDVTINDLTVTMDAATTADEEEPWQGVYGIQVYNSSDVVLNSVTAAGGDGGILINSSEATLTGAIDVSGNEFGGIEVSKGKDENGEDLAHSLKLTATGATITNNSENTDTNPTIWVDLPAPEDGGQYDEGSAKSAADALFTDEHDNGWIKTYKSDKGDYGQVWYTEAEESSDATLTSTIGIVDNETETIMSIPYGTTLAAFKSAITPAQGGSFEVYEDDGTTVATDLQSNYKVIVTAEDGTTKTYTLTVEAAEHDYTVSIGDEIPGGAGQTRTLTIGGAQSDNLTNKYLVVAIREGGGEDAKVSVVEFALTGKIVKISYNKAGAGVETWVVTDAYMPDFRTNIIDAKFIAHATTATAE